VETLALILEQVVEAVELIHLTQSTALLVVEMVAQV
jgi:hypothetical protein